MNDHQVMGYARIISVYGQIEGMKSENLIRVVKGESPAYSEEDFIQAIQSISEEAMRSLLGW